MAQPVLTIALPDEAATARSATVSVQPRAWRRDRTAGRSRSRQSTLARGLIRSQLGPETEAPSPTFTLVQTYQGPTFPIWHFDLYRLEHPGEARELGLEEAVDGLALIEWPERLDRYLPSARLEVQLSFGVQGRIARLVDFDDWSARIDGDWRLTS
jgi:tRNA threonylcarbamoyladenosine biosynthesis protein TsaE